ncbi:hypothetical protein ACTVJH_07055 [Desulfoplanes sp. PS50]
MNNDHKHTLFTAVFVLALLIGGGVLLTRFEDLKNTALIGLLILAGIGCLVQGRSRPTKKKSSNPDNPTEPKKL